MKIIGNNPAANNAEITAVASGTLPSGQPVVVNADGTVSVVAPTSVSETVGSATVFESTTTSESAAVYDSNAQKVIVSYRNSTGRGEAVVGTVSGNSISFGTPVQFTSRTIEFSAIAYDSSNSKVVIAFADSASPRYGYAIVGDVSGTSISFGTETVFNSYEVQEVSIGYDANAGKVVIVYEDWGNSNQGIAIVGTVSGTSISFGSEVVFDSNRSRFMSVTYDANAQKIVVAYIYDSNAAGYAVVGTVSGTSISFGTPVQFESSPAYDIFATYDANAQKVVIAYRDGGNSNYGTAIVGTVSGTAISFGTAAVFNSSFSNSISATYHANFQKVIVACNDGEGTVVAGTVSGTSITFENPFVFDSSSTSNTGIAYDANTKKTVIAYTDGGNSNFGTGVVYESGGISTNLTSENYIGMANGAAADGGKARVDIGCGINGAQSGLTAGQTYYVQTDGTLGLTAADPSVIAGTAISATEIIVKG